MSYKATVPVLIYTSVQGLETRNPTSTLVGLELLILLGHVLETTRLTSTFTSLNLLFFTPKHDVCFSSTWVPNTPITLRRCYPQYYFRCFSFHHRHYFRRFTWHPWHLLLSSTHQHFDCNNPFVDIFKYQRCFDAFEAIFCVLNWLHLWNNYLKQM